MPKKIPTSIMAHRNGWLYKGLWKRLHNQNKQLTIVIVGKRGFGKSWASIRLAYALDRDSSDVPRFSISKICFSPLQFLEQVNKELPRGSFCILDDSGLQLFSRDAMTKTSKELSKVLQSFRFLNRGLILNLPSLSFLDKSARAMIDAYIEMLPSNFEKHRSKAKFHFLNCDPRTGKLYHHRPVRRLDIGAANSYSFKHSVLVDNIFIDSPPKGLTKGYESFRAKSMKEFYKKTHSQLLTATEPKKKKNSFAEDVAKVRKNLKKYLKPNGKMVSKEKLKMAGYGKLKAASIASFINSELKNTLPPQVSRL